MSKELWKTTKYPGYSVSDQGRVIGKWGKVLSCPPNRQGYRTFTLKQGGKQISVYVHRLVLETFVGPCPPGLEACHNDDIKANNQLNNLRWDTRSNNFKDQVANGRHGQARKTHCPWGHPFGEPNQIKSAKGRSCLACRRAKGYVKYRVTLGEVWDEQHTRELADAYFDAL